MGHNNFNKDELVRWYIDNYECWKCSLNTNDSFHHIVGRGYISSNVEKSLLNSAPLCNFTCHLNIHGKLRTTECVRLLLNKTYVYLINNNYTLTTLDKSFMFKYKDFYKNDIIKKI